MLAQSYNFMGTWAQTRKTEPELFWGSDQGNFNAAQMPVCRHLVEEAAELAQERGGRHEERAEERKSGRAEERKSGRAEERKSGRAEEFIDRLSFLFELEILKVVPGSVSTEVAARLSFDTAGYYRQGPPAHLDA